MFSAGKEKPYKSIDLSNIDWEKEFSGPEFEKSVEEFFAPFIEEAKREDEYEKVYLNKLDVILLIKRLASESEPMVSAPSYDYYSINAGLLLDEANKLKTYGKGDIWYAQRNYERSS